MYCSLCGLGFIENNRCVHCFAFFHVQTPPARTQPSAAPRSTVPTAPTSWNRGAQVPSSTSQRKSVRTGQVRTPMRTVPSAQGEVVSLSVIKGKRIQGPERVAGLPEAKAVPELGSVRRCPRCSVTITDARCCRCPGCRAILAKASGSPDCCPSCKTPCKPDVERCRECGEAVREYRPMTVRGRDLVS